MEFTTNKIERHYFKGQIYYADFGIGEGSEQGGIRPAIIIQNNTGNHFSPTVIVAPVTKAVHIKANIPTHVMLAANETGLREDSIALLEQPRVLDKTKLKQQAGNVHFKSTIMQEINNAIAISFGLVSKTELQNNSVHSFVQ